MGGEGFLLFNWKKQKIPDHVLLQDIDPIFNILMIWLEQARAFSGTRPFPRNDVWDFEITNILWSNIFFVFYGINLNRFVDSKSRIMGLWGSVTFPLIAASMRIKVVSTLTRHFFKWLLRFEAKWFYLPFWTHRFKFYPRNDPTNAQQRVPVLFISSCLILRIEIASTPCDGPLVLPCLGLPQHWGGA